MLRPEQPRISVIVPAYNSARDLAECLSALASPAHHQVEVIVVDDASTDDTAAVAARNGARVLRLDSNLGPGGARNHGALHARGDILLFVDADVVLAGGAIGRVASVFDEHPDVAAVIGSYDAEPRAQNVASQYMNLRHHYVHQQGKPEASTFWAGCGAIRRSVFQALGGFDGLRFRRPSIEDIELGYRLHRAGHRILLDKGLRGKHLKHWTIRSLISTDITRRAIPWSRLIVESGRAPDDLNLKLGQRAGAAFTTLGCAFLPAGLAGVELLVLPAASLLAAVALNHGLFGFFRRQRGLPFALACVPLHLLYYLYSTLSYLYVRSTWRVRGAGLGLRGAGAAEGAP